VNAAPAEEFKAYLPPRRSDPRCVERKAQARDGSDVEGVAARREACEPSPTAA